MHRAVGVVLVAGLVVLAGCSGVFGGHDPTTTLTPAAVPTDQPTPTPVASLAPGLTGNGIENVSALIAAHESFLRGTSFTTTANATGTASNGTVVVRQTSTLRAGPPGTSALYAGRSGDDSYFEGRPTHIAIWSNGERTFVRQTYANGTAVYRQQPAEPRLGTTGTRLRYILKPFENASTSVTRQNRNGTTLYLVRGNTHSEVQGNLSVELLVDGRGVIHRYRTVQRTTGEHVTTFVSETRISGIGTTDAPARPSWVGTASNRTTAAFNGTTATRG